MQTIWKILCGFMLLALVKSYHTKYSQNYSKGLWCCFIRYNSNGLREAKKIFGLDIEIVYAPWDLKWFISNFKNSAEALILFEIEIPNMITQSFKNKIPIILSNGRMSKSSFERYKKFNFLSNIVFQKITHAFVQSEAHKERFNLLGIDNQRISNVGSVKLMLK